jgi:hypothetical protein
MDSSPGASRLPENGSTLVDFGVPGEAASISQPVLRARSA